MSLAMAGLSNGRGAGGGNRSATSSSSLASWPGVQAAVRIDGAGRVEHRGQRPHPLRRNNRPLDAGHQGAKGRVGGEWHRAGHAFYEHQRQRVHVGPAIQSFASHLFRRRVASGADYGAGRFGPRGLGQRSGQAEVGDGEAALVVEDQVRRLDVSMHQAAPVGVVEGACRVSTDGRGLGGGKQMAAIQERPEAAALEQLHDEIRRPSVVAPVVHPQDVGMPQRGHHLGLGAETATERLIGRQRGMEQLDGDSPAQVHVFGRVDVSRRAHAERADQAVTVSEDAPRRIGDARGRHTGRGYREGFSTTRTLSRSRRSVTPRKLRTRKRWRRQQLA